MAEAQVVYPGHRVRVEAKGQAHYWTETAAGVLLAPRLADLVSAMARPKLSVSALAAMASGRASIWLSPFEDVHRLTFGHELVVSPTGPTVERWLRPESIPESTGDPADVMRAAIVVAIAEATRGRSGATVALSGGLDSTTVLALAARFERLYPGLRGYCAIADTGGPQPPRGRFADEWPLAEAAAVWAGVPAAPLRDDGSFDLLDACERFHRRNLMPVPTPANLWWLTAIERRAEQTGHRIILTGQSGNATFSNGLPSAPSPLQRDGTWVGPTGVRGLRRKLRGWRRDGLPGVVRPLPVRMPDHVLDMDPWTRWCLAEPPAPSRGPWTGADVEWLDPLGSARVITAAMSLPPAAWGKNGRERRLARDVGRGLLPDEVRLCRQRGIQGADFPRHLVSKADAYAEAIDRVAQSPTAREFLDTEQLRRALPLISGDLRSARVFQQVYLKPLNVGLFAAWWDDECRSGRVHRSQPCR